MTIKSIPIPVAALGTDNQGLDAILTKEREDQTLP